MALSDFNKCSEILAELVYYIFDSFLIPLIRSNFHVTESSGHRHRLFYFRHDIWKRMTEPAIAHLKQSMLDSLELGHATSLLNGRAQGFSHIRFIPKDEGMRSITNLRRRAHVINHGVKTFGRSINSIVTPAFNVLNFEKVRFLRKDASHPWTLRSSFLDKHASQVWLLVVLCRWHSWSDSIFRQ